MTALSVSFIAFMVNLIVVVVLLVRYYGDDAGEARKEAAFWRRKAERLDEPNS